MANFILTQATRNAARGIVRAAQGFADWRKAKGYGNHLTTSQIHEAALALGVMDQVQALIDAQGARSEWNEPDVTSADDEGVNDVDESSEAPASEAESSVDVVAQDIDRVLDPIRPFLASKILGAVEARLRPIVVEAHKPARIVETQAPTPLRPGEAPRAKRVSESTMGKLFGARGAHGAHKVALWDSVDAPAPDGAYVVEPSRFVEIVTALEHGENVWLAGGAGTGKTSLAREYAARTKRPFVRIGFTRSTEIIDLLGQKEPIPSGESGAVEMVWKDHVWTQAIRRPGAVILLDELTIAPPGTVALFQTMLDEKRVTLPTGEIVSFADGVVVIIADNTAGYGDEFGNLRGNAKRQCGAC